MDLEPPNFFVSQNYQLADFLYLAVGMKKVDGTPAGKKIAGRLTPNRQGKNPACYSSNSMKISVNTTALSSEQMKFLSPLENS